MVSPRARSSAAKVRHESSKAASGAHSLRMRLALSAYHPPCREPKFGPVPARRCSSKRKTTIVTTANIRASVAPPEKMEGNMLVAAVESMSNNKLHSTGSLRKFQSRMEI